MLERGRQQKAEAATVPASGPKGATTKTDVKQQITEATQTLRGQLNEVTKNFRDTITDLERMEGGFLGSVRVLSNLINQVAQFKGSHAARVESLSVRLGKACNVNREDLRNLKVAALLHDIGQFGMPDTVRRQPPHSLSPDERAVFHSYPSIGAALLSEVTGAEAVVELIETHAENYDGSGFPQGLRGERIPLGARIIRIADGFDTFMLFEENASEPWNNARHHLTTHKDVYYDPGLVDLALQFSSELEDEAKADNVKEIPSSELLIGQVLAQNVYDHNGRFLARQGAEISASMLPRLQRLAHNQSIKIFAKTQPKEGEDVASEE
ncbi:MAG: HD domain-containing phosphohydrolase [Candidatus Hydrogenedentota bacterium]